MIRIHERVAELLAAEGAHLDDFHYCPHHPETHWAEGVEALRGPCACRKPSTGMVDLALSRSSRPAWRAVVIGDETCDLQLAMNAGLASIAVDTGHGCRDARYPARATWRFPSLVEAARWLCGGAP
jgi:histidinol-phosphate phosphatase family protein